MPLKLIFMGTPEFAVPILNSLLKSSHNLLAVYTQNPNCQTQKNVKQLSFLFI